MRKGIAFKYYDYIPGDSPDECHTVRVAILPQEVMDRYDELAFSDEQLDYINSVLSEYGYKDEDIFFYFTEDSVDCWELIKDTPDEGDVLKEPNHGL